MKRFISNLLQQANLPLTSGQFWRYAGIFWATLAIISYVQNTLVWLVNGKPKMYITESLQWLITYLMWFGFTPLILYAARRFPIRLMGGARSWEKPSEFMCWSHRDLACW